MEDDNMAGTEIVFILDRSGSMSGLESDTIGGFNAFLKKQKELEGEARVTTVLFDDQYEVLYERLDLKAANLLTTTEYFVRGSTALLDAVGKTVSKFKHELDAEVGSFKASKVIFIITTDGQENSSSEYNHSQVKGLIEAQKEKGWEFVFLGANIDAVEVAGRMGFSASRSKNYHNDAQGVELNFAVLSNAVSMFRSAPSASLDDSWGDEIDEDFAERDDKKKKKKKK
jgi:uncharacterized protein YegL